MENAIGYIRISSKDQSNFSLAAQEDHVRKFAERSSFNLVALFTDNGQSAKNFDRAEWKKLEEFIKAHHRNLSVLIVPKYDRFSRNVSEALQMIEKLEDRFEIRIISVFEPIHARPDSPYFFQFRTQMLMNAQVERLVIIERTRTGLNLAMKRGYWVNNAPYGYRNYRNNRNEPTLIIDEPKAIAVRKAYEMFLQGTGFREIHLVLKHSYGFKMEGKGCVQRILSNPVYAGMVKVPSFMDEPEQIVKGIHEPIISSETWWKANELMRPKSRTNKMLSDDFPLRGSLNCHCGRHLTAAFSQGKKSRIGYYFCFSHRSANLRASVLHDQFMNILRELSLPDSHIEYLRTLTDQEMKKVLVDKEVMLDEKKKQLRAVNQKLETLQEQFLERQWSAADYSKWNNRLHGEKVLIEKEIADLARPIELTWKLYAESLYRLGDLSSLYELADLHQKQAFVSMLFDSKLYYQDGMYRTPYILEIFKPKATSLQQNRLLVIEQPAGKRSEIDGCTAYGNRTRHSSVKGMRLNRLTNAAFPFWECKDKGRV